MLLVGIVINHFDIFTFLLWLHLFLSSCLYLNGLLLLILLCICTSPMIIVMLVIVILVKVVVSIWCSRCYRWIISSIASLSPVILLLGVVALLRIVLLWMSILTISILIRVAYCLWWWRPYLRRCSGNHWNAHFNIASICTIIKYITHWFLIICLLVRLVGACCSYLSLLLLKIELSLLFVEFLTHLRLLLLLLSSSGFSFLSFPCFSSFTC